MCFVVIVLGKVVYFFSPLPLSKSRLAVITFKKVNARARSKIGKFRRDYAVKNIAFAPAILSVAGKLHPEFLRLLWVLADMQTIKYFNLVGDKQNIGNERFKWSWASTFSYNRNVIGLTLHTLQPYALICRFMALLTP